MLSIRYMRSMAILAMIAVFSLCTPTSLVRAADHADSTSVANDPGLDLGDSFAFLDPADNTRVILGVTIQGFIVPSEAVNLGYFTPEILYRFEIENTGDSIPDQFIDITFSPQTSRNMPQTATVVRYGGTARRSQFTAPTTLATLNNDPNPFVVTTDARSGMKFYAGLTDDPFYFDIVGFGRFVGSVLGGTPDPTQLERSRDSFAGYNIHSIMLSVPASLLRGSAGNTIGVNTTTLRRQNATRGPNGTIVTSGPYVQIDRAATPALNTALIPFPRKNEYNASTPLDDHNGVFAGDIVNTLTALGTSPDNIAILASVAVANGDYLRLNLDQANTSLGFGERITTPGYTGFPNGRRPGDDTVDTLLYFITNQAIEMGDNVNSNEVPLTSSFPFLGLPHQPFAAGTIDDRTRN